MKIKPSLLAQFYFLKKIMKYLFTSAFSLLFLVTPIHAVEKASEERLDEIVQRGIHVMPFDLELTTHVFSKTPKGGVQEVIVKNTDDCEQIKLIREHLTKIATEFKQGDFSNPAKIHGDGMAGLDALRKAKSKQIKIEYQDLPNGARITYSTDEAVLTTAIHQWFDAQLSDHARHAISGHDPKHEMHHQ